MPSVQDDARQQLVHAIHQVDEKEENPMTTKETYGDGGAGSTTEIQPPEAVPPITFVGRPLMFIAIDASSLMQGGIPLELCWTPDAAIRPTSRLIKPPMDWQDRPQDDPRDTGHGLSIGTAIKHGEPIQRVAKDTFDAFASHRLISVFPSLDRVWMNELFLLTPIELCFRFVSLADLTLKIAHRIGLDEESFIRAAIDSWFKVFKPGPAVARVQDMAGLVHAILHAAVVKNLIDPRQSLEIEG
jgi:hypothetical protein